MSEESIAVENLHDELRRNREAVGACAKELHYISETLFDMLETIKSVRDMVKSEIEWQQRYEPT